MSNVVRSGLLAGTAVVALVSSALAAETIEKVVVTAQKRSQDVQKVPISMSVLTGSQLDDRGVSSFSALQNQSPSLSFGAGVTGGESAITMRGVGTENVTGGGDPGVALHLDGIYVGRTAGIDQTFFDIERIEVLRGPQGTLYGRNSTGGAINIISRKPELGVFSSSADLSYGNYSAVTGRAMFNLPVGESAALRVSGVINSRDGYQNILSPTSVCGDCEADAADDVAVRGQFLLKLSESADLLISGGHYENNEPVGIKLAEPFPANGSGILGTNRFVGASPNPADPRDVYKDYRDALTMQKSNVSATVNWGLQSGMTLTSITAYDELQWNQQADGDGSDLPLAYTEYWSNQSYQVSQELRLASSDASANKWVVGAFFYRENVNQGFRFVDTGYNVFGPAPIPGDLFSFTNGGNIETRSMAVFGQNDYRIDEGVLGMPVTVTAGLRYTKDEKRGNDFLDFIFFGGCAIVVPSATSHCAAKDFDESWNTLTGRAGIQVEQSENVMWYATASRGYRSGGVLVGNFPGAYDPEYIWNYEGGVKSLLWDKRLQLNASAFYNKYSDMQVFIQDIGGSRIENAASATIKGIEIDALAKPTDDLTLNLGFSWLDATYDSYTTIDSRAGSSGLPEDLSGNRLNRTPEFAFIAGAQYDIPTSAGLFSLRGDFMWKDEVFFRAQNLPVDRQDAHTKTDLRAIWYVPGDQYKAEIFVQNLEDEDVVNNIVIPAQTIGGPTSQISLNPPRTFGVRFSVDVGG
jgi:iron complex outermembrane receptor protein